MWKKALVLVSLIVVLLTATQVASAHPHAYNPDPGPTAY